MVADVPETGTYLRNGVRMVEVLGKTDDGEGVEVENIVTDIRFVIPLDNLHRWSAVEREADGVASA